MSEYLFISHVRPRHSRNMITISTRPALRSAPVPVLTEYFFAVFEILPHGNWGRRICHTCEMALDDFFFFFFVVLPLSVFTALWPPSVRPAFVVFAFLRFGSFVSELDLDFMFAAFDLDAFALARDSASIFSCSRRPSMYLAPAHKATSASRYRSFLDCPAKNDK